MSDDYVDRNEMAALSDNMLAKRLGRGDVTSFETLFFRHYDRVYGLLFRLVGNRQEAEDVAQEVFIKLYRQRFDGRDEHNINAWLYRVTTNLGYNHIRDRKRRWKRNSMLVPDVTDDSLNPADAALQTETRDAVRSALLHLPRRQVQLLVLRQMGFSYAELAESCAVAPGSVGTMLARAADAFRVVYKKELSGKG